MAQSTGIGKVTFGGVDLTSSPYYAHLTQEAKYWFLDGQQSTQFITGPTSLVSSMPYFQTFLLHLVFRIEPADGTRASMIYALTQLTSVLDPAQGEQKLVFAEFPGSYFMAKKQTSSLQNETSVPYMVELAVEFACTGPAYSNSESIVTVDVTNAAAEYLLTSFGDTKASPRWRFTASEGYTGTVTWNNYTTSEQVTWTGTIAAGQTLDIIMDEYGVSHTVLVNGNPSTATAVGPAWPHVVPGDNLIFFSGPSAGTLETRWRDRYLVGLQSAPSIETRRGICIDILRLPTLTGEDYYQGVMNDGTYNYACGTTGLYKFDANWNFIESNLHAAADAAGVHMGDGDIYDGVIYTINGSTTCCDPPWPICYIARFNASDLSVIDHIGIGDVGGNPPDYYTVSAAAAGIDYDNSLLLIPSFSNGTVFRFDLETFAYKDSVSPQFQLPETQGVSYYGGFYYLTSTVSGLVRMNLDGTDTKVLMPPSTFIHGGEIEGLDVKSDFMRICTTISSKSDGYIYTIPMQKEWTE